MSVEISFHELQHLRDLQEAFYDVGHKNQNSHPIPATRSSTRSRRSPLVSNAQTRKSFPARRPPLPRHFSLSRNLHGWRTPTQVTDARRRPPQAVQIGWIHARANGKESSRRQLHSFSLNCARLDKQPARSRSAPTLRSAHLRNLHGGGERIAGQSDTGQA